MKLIINEFRLLKKDILRLLSFSIVLTILNSIIYLKNSTPYRLSSSGEVLYYLFSTTKDYGNWVYWIVFMVGYVIILLVIWKKHVHLFEVNQLMRNQKVMCYWISKGIIGIIMTIYYVTSTFLITSVACVSVGIPFAIIGSEAIICIILIFNMYLHAMLWLYTKNIMGIEISNILILTLIYAGTKLDSPFIPLYYALFPNLGTMWYIVIIIELTIISLIWGLILIKAKKMDYM